MDSLFLKSIEKSNLIKPNQKITLAVSGGADSMYLFYNFVDLGKKLNLDILVCHLNHGVRETAKRDQDFVINKCRQENIKCVTKSVNMNEYAKKNKISSEDAGRILRYEFFRENSKDRLIVTAHNANDRAETILQRIIRGTGINGLVSIKESRDDIYRPLIDITRDDIEKYLHDNDLDYVNDETNFKEIYTRNKIRLSLIPKLKEYNPNIVSSLLRLSENARDAMNFIDFEVDKYYDKVICDKTILIKNLEDVHEFVGREIIRKFLETNFKNCDIVTRENIINIYNLKELQSGKRLDLGSNIVARRTFDKISLEEMEKETKDTEKVYLKMGLNKTKYGDFYLELNRQKDESTVFNIMLDYGKIKGSLCVRYRENGDRFSPLGMKGTKKLKDYFIDRKVDLKKRNTTPIICDEEKILWIVGMDISEDAKIDSNTCEILHLEVKK